MRDIQRESKSIQRAASREYIRQRVQAVAREVQRETVAEIRAALRDSGFDILDNGPAEVRS